MVWLVGNSNIDPQLFPFTHEWDSLVRKHYNKYQQLIDAQTYQLQRVKRYLLVYNSFNSEIALPTYLRLRYCSS